MSARYLAVLVPVMCAVLTLGAAPAKADSVTYVLDIGGTGLSGSPGPYAWVTFAYDAANRAIVASINTNTVLGYGFKDNFGFNSSLSGLTFSSGVSFSQNGTLDGFGRFSYVINSLGNGTTYSFSIYKSGGFNSLSEFTSSLTLTSGGVLMSLHSTVPGSTGWSGGLNTVNPVPEPASLALLGSGIVALGGIARKRRSKAS